MVNWKRETNIDGKILSEQFNNLLPELIIQFSVV